MINVLNIYPYMYYRLATWYFKFEKKSNISFAASALVTLSQTMILTDIAGMIILNNFDKSERIALLNKAYPFYVVLILVIAFINDFKFRKKYDLYQEKWKDESLNRRKLKGIAIATLIILPIIFFPIVLNIFNYSN